MRSKYLFLFLLPLMAAACNTSTRATGNTAMGSNESADDMTPSGEPMLEGSGEWTNLMPDGDLSAWHSYQQDGVGSAWKIDDDGAVYLDTSNKGENGVEGGGDLVTNESYGAYELELEWKIGDCGNSGIIYNVNEEDTQSASYMTGPEMQIVDNACHPDAKIPKHRAGDLYDMVSSSTENVKPAGKWNRVRLLVSEGRVEQWQNGKMIVAYTNDGPEWEAMIGNSKFKDWESFGSYTSGKIALQDHGDPVWFRNIRIRDLESK